MIGKNAFTRVLASLHGVTKRREKTGEYTCSQCDKPLIVGFEVEKIEVASQSNKTRLKSLSDKEFLEMVTEVIGEMQNRGWSDIRVTTELGGSFKGMNAFLEVRIRCVGFSGI